jgi:phosphodiesterase/alkaline phosphatase D-like protein
MRAFRVIRRVLLVCVGVVGVLLCVCGPAFAVAPEAPELTVEAKVPSPPSPPSPSSEVVLLGVLSPHATPSEGGVYEFLYKASTVGECRGGGVAPASPGLYFGVEHEVLPAETLVGLTAGTEYAVCLRVENTAGEETLGAAVSFTTAVPPETPATREPEAVTGTSAVLRGELNPYQAGEAGGYEFTYEQSESECGGGSVAPEPPGAASGAVKEGVQVSVSNLEPNRAYVVCVVAINGGGEVATGQGWPFRTLAPAAHVAGSSLHASVVSPFEERLEAVANPENQATSCVFEYGPTTSYGESRPCDAPTIEGFGEEGVGVNVGFLSPGTKYHFRVLVKNATGGSEEAGEFTTASLSAPSVEGAESVSGVTSTSATFEAQVNAGYQITTYSFEYATKATGQLLEGPITTVKGAYHLGVGGVQGVSVPSGVLAPGTRYYYRAVAANATAPTAVGTVESFVTVPAPGTDAASAVTATTATLHGHLAPLNGEATTQYHFIYSVGGECQPGNLETPVEEAGTGSGEVAESENVSVLQPNATYTVCFVASNGFGSVQGPPTHFTTLAAPPVIDAQGAPVVTPFQGLLEAQVNPNNQPTTGYLQYSTSNAVNGSGALVTATKVPAGAVSLGAGFGDSTLSGETPTTLTPGTPYFFQGVATNTSGTVYGPVEEFKTTSPEAPVIENENASNITPTSATIEAQVNPNYQTTKYSFEYAEKESTLLAGGTSVAGGVLPAGSITESDHTATAQLTNLTPNHVYYYRVLASNTTGPARATLTVAHFTTANTPRAGSEPVGAVTATSATLAGSVNPDGIPTSYYFQYGGTSFYGYQTQASQAGTATTPTSHTTLLTGLEPGRVYHYRIIAINENNGSPQIAYGEDETFQTPATPPILSELKITSITSSSATITATLNPQALQTHYELQVGPTPTQLTPRIEGETTSTTPLALTAEALNPSSVYYYKLTATNQSGTSEPEGSFTTTPTPPPPPATTNPTTIPYTTITELNNKENQENHPHNTPLTLHQKLTKALKACKKQKNKHKRTTCEKHAHNKYNPTKHTH